MLGNALHHMRSTRKMLLMQASKASLCEQKRGWAASISSNFPPILSSMLPADSFKDRVALVTGGGTGLGKGIARQLCLLGANVFILSRKLPALEAAAEEIRREVQATKERGGSGYGRITPLAADIRDAKAIKVAVDEMISMAASVPDIVINNAAGNFVAPFERLNAKGFATIVDIVLNGTANVTLDIGKRLIDAGKPGVFLNITTTYGSTGSGYVIPSAAAKAGVTAMTKSLAVEWGKYGIRSVGIAPGPIETKGAFERLDPTGQFASVMLRNNPSGRFGRVEELANLAAYMTSDYASWLNGEIITLDGGETPFNAGQFNFLSRVTPQQWDEMEQKIREVNKKGSS